MEFLAFVLIIAVVWMIFRARILALERRLETLSHRSVTEEQLASLARRISALEQAGAVAPGPREPIAPAQSPMQVQPEPEPAPPPPPQIREVPASPPVSIPERDPEPEPVLQAPLSERLRDRLGSEEWESLIGGSILNKVGAVVLVIGMALFLGYSFGHMTAAGRAALALAVSLALLGAGVWVERRGQYRVFSRGLVGAGWAALYATSYAIYAIPEARIIDNPFIGSLGTLVVAAGMVWHSLRYRSQAVTAVAFFAAFAALAASPSSPFAVVSLIPLAVSLLFLSTRFEWNYLPLFGLLATYGTCVSRGSSDSPLASTQALFLAYWLVFEGFDLLRVKNRLLAGGVEWILPLNAIGFTGLSWLTWSHHAPDRLWFAAAWGAGLYLADAIARTFLRPPSSFDPGETSVDRLRAGSYEGSVVISAILAGLSIAGRVPGIWSSAGYAIEAEIIYLSGIRFGSGLLRDFGARSFVISLGRLAFTAETRGTTDILGHTTMNWTPAALLHVLLFYINRAIRTPNLIFSSMAAAIVAAVLACELPEEFVGAAWILFGAVLFEVGLRKTRIEFRLQGYLVLIAGFAATCFLTVSWSHKDLRALAISMAVSYGCALRSRWLSDPPVGSTERGRFAAGSSIAVVLLSALLLREVVPVAWLGLSWSLLALVLFELGNRRLPAELRWSFGPMQLAATSVILITQTDGFGRFPPGHVSITWFGACIIAWLAAARLILRPGAETTVPEQTLIRDWMIVWGSFAALTGAWFVLPDPFIPAAWVALSLAFVAISHRLDVLSLRISAVAIALLALVAAFFYNIEPPQILVTSLIVMGFYAAQFLSKPLAEKWAPVLYSLLGTLLLCALLYGQVSGGVLTVSWGVVGLALLGAGFPLRERVLRLQALVLLLVCILKLFLYDLRNLETLYRILSFVALGVILLAVSWIYTRFRKQLKRLL